MPSELIGRNPEQTPAKEKAKPTVGIWLLFLTPDNKIFVVENSIAKYVSQKVPGQVNAPAETYQPTDGSFATTIERAIQEEVGRVDFDRKLITPLGFNRLNVLGKNVIAAPYLIPIEDQSNLQYDPEDQTESTNPHWIDIDSVNPNVFLEIGPFKVPYFRTPMVENIQMLINYKKKGVLQFIRSTAITIPQEVYDYLESDKSSDLLA